MMSAFSMIYQHGIVHIIKTLPWGRKDPSVLYVNATGDDGVATQEAWAAAMLT